MKAETGDDLTLIEMTRRFSTEESAREYFEALRWPNGPVCPHCGNANGARIYKVTANAAKKIRAGLYKCAECQQGFTVTINTVMEDSHLPLNKWLIAFYMMCASKTQVSALQLQRQLEIGSYRSAWFLCHRIRFSLQDTFPADKLSGTVEADETYVGGKARGKGLHRQQDARGVAH
jgi:transposase-like protein